ncbi:hypothetical protein D3OALGA1CA_1803 [Olavius algarvensis associated proteobacterium Delta 3]|nr:hypothetical protein D3OALGA1CA_1803 [Olavius algarvensis associated proteobacterium Delta 3]
MTPEIGKYLKNWIRARDQGEPGTQPPGIFAYVGELRRGFNTDIGRKDFFEMLSQSTQPPFLFSFST